ncbi:MAG: cysteine hydrolase [Candidatus Thiodiazotropha sp. (ex Troendleina suluensis)]|nr:cysteine hydrolase [Candidatus Thiodiazotropha sp. (ex Troendleina suluensis)]
MKKCIVSLLLLLPLSTSISAYAETTPLNLIKQRTALVVTDPQNDFLDKKGIAYGLFAENIKELDTITNIEKLLTTAKKHAMPVFVSPHAYFEHDHSWENPGALQKKLLALKVFNRKDAVYATGLKGTGADFLAQYKPYILDGKTVVTSPHKIYGPDSNDLVLQLRSKGIDTVILAGLAANLCTDSHLRELVESGFKVIVVKDAVAAPGSDAYQAALVNYGLIANAVITTDDAVKTIAR